MKWILPGEYSRKQVDNAGKILAKAIILDDDIRQENFIKIFHNWRSSHAYPMHIIMMTLKNMAKGLNDSSLCVQRLKRVPSVIEKLRRYSMNLSQIQDIAGCRVVLPSIELARELSEQYISSNGRHKRVKKRERNYVNNPKDDGYRSIHLVYEYYSTNTKRAHLYNGKLVEIQIRSSLQHAWATALETVDLFEVQKMKFGKGDIKWRRFFALMSSAFAIMEDSPLVPNTPTNKKELYSEIVRLEKELNVFERMNSWADSINFLKTKEGKYFILILDIEKKEVEILNEKEDKNLSKFLEVYADLEKKHKDDKNFDVVLVGADNIHDLNRAYPNYFADTKEFLRHLYDVKMEFSRRD